ncbi:hypothetical protein TMatcc_001241 [Talaromyces marneffei ATCC 18224]|nr:hypothetical protein EYB25_008667 [Talaromyces marneffei]
MVSESPPGPEAGKGLAPVLEGLAPAAKGLVTSLSKCQDPPQYQAPSNHQKQAISTLTVPRNIAKPQAAPPKQAPKNWASTAGTAQQGNDGDWKTVQYNKKRGINNASGKPEQPLIKPISTRSKEERRLIFRRYELIDTVRRDTRDILLWLNRALDSAGLPIFMRAVDAGYAASGHLTVLMKDGTPSKVLVPAYNDMLLTAIRRADPAVISVEVSEQWQRVNVHGVHIQRYMNSSKGLELAREEIEIETPFRLKRDPTWLKSPKVLRARRQGFATIVVTVGSREEARGLLKAGLKFGGHHYKTEAYWDIIISAMRAFALGAAE